MEVVLFTFNKEKMADDNSAEDGVDSSNLTEVCTNYRFARRHDPAHMPKDEEDSKDKRDQSESPLAKKPTKVQSSKRKGGDNKQKKDPAQIEAEEKAAREAEEEKKIKEAEFARKKAEEMARAAYRPKAYTAEEKASWAAQKQELEQFFSSIVMRQSNDSTGASV